MGLTECWMYLGITVEPSAVRMLSTLWGLVCLCLAVAGTFVLTIERRSPIQGHPEATANLSEAVGELVNQKIASSNRTREAKPPFDLNCVVANTVAKWHRLAH